MGAPLGKWAPKQEYAYPSVPRVTKENFPEEATPLVSAFKTPSPTPAPKAPPNLRACGSWSLDTEELGKKPS